MCALVLTQRLIRGIISRLAYVLRVGTLADGKV